MSEEQRQENLLSEVERWKSMATGASLECAALKIQVHNRDALLLEAVSEMDDFITSDLSKRVRALLSAGDAIAAVKQETHAEMRVRHKREFDALCGDGFHYEECSCGTNGSYPDEVTWCVCGKPFASVASGSPKGCRTCGGLLVVRSIEGQPPHARDGGEVPCPSCIPAEVDERAEFERWHTKTKFPSVADGRLKLIPGYFGRYGSHNFEVRIGRAVAGTYIRENLEEEFTIWNGRAALGRKS